MSIRALSARRLPVTRLAAPAVVVAAALSLGAAQGPAPQAQRALADSRPLAGSHVMMPFAATPRTYPLVASSAAPPPAPTPSAPPVATLPASLAASAPTIPRRVLAAYVNAAHLTDTTEPQCRLSWQMLAGIGLVESDNAIAGGSADPAWDGVANPPIYGPPLDGRHGTARLPDTNPGIDGGGRWARAIGPMQLMPATWAGFAADGNHDGAKNPQDIDDASLAAGHYLCAVSPRLDRPTHLIRAIYGYNHSYSYVRHVLTAIAGYLRLNPARLGINGLPHRHRRSRRHGVLVAGIPTSPLPMPTTPATGPPTPVLPTPSPTHSWPASPTPTPTPHLPRR